MDPAMQGVIVGGSIAIVSSVVGAYVNHRLELRRMKTKEEQEEAKLLREKLLGTTVAKSRYQGSVQGSVIGDNATTYYVPSEQQRADQEIDLMEQQLALELQMLEKLKAKRGPTQQRVNAANDTVEQALEKARKKKRVTVATPPTADDSKDDGSPPDR